MKIINYEDAQKSMVQWAGTIDFPIVKKILGDIVSRGDDAIYDYTKEFDGVSLNRVSISVDTFSRGFSSLDEQTLLALNNSADRLKRFAEKQLSQCKDFEFEIEPGVITGQRVIPLDRVGIYAPGGNFPLVSSLLMGAIPAKVAGVQEVVVCTPPGKDGEPSPAILAAAAIAQVDELYTVGGIQAIGAMAIGTESIRAVDKIVGPGNQYVTAAKKEVFGRVGIDFIAGPSEVMIIADKSANPKWVASDLLAQAEHDVLAIPILTTDSLALAQEVQNEIKEQLSVLSTRSIASESMASNGRIILCDTIEEAISLANRMAPEHLELHLDSVDKYVQQCKHFGSLFIGGYSAEVLGDYSSGLNHTLPTAGAARYSSGLSVRDFIKISTTLKVNQRGMNEIGPDASALANIEGLTGHANASAVRM
jgi:histidinol dehydrogenase